MDNSFWLWTDCYWKVLQGRLNVWEKIKSIFSVIGAFLSIILFTILLFVLRRGKADRRGSERADERDTRIQDGIGECKERADRIEERIERAESSAGRCEEHLQRAEDILREAIRRSREERERSKDLIDNNHND